MHFLLFYDVVENFVERRAPHRAAHLKHIQAAFDRGELVLAGALAEPADQAILLFRSDSPATVERFAATDPYVTEGLVTRWRVRKWMTVNGRGEAV